MPYKHETNHIKLTGLQDRRRKLTEEQYIEIREKREQGKSLMYLAREYGVSKKLILLIVNPESKQKQDEYIKNHWREFRQSQEYCTKATRETRRYKQELMMSGKLTKEQ